jgi:hypothetical protein
MSKHETDSKSDIYQEGAAIAFDVPLDQVTKQQRQAFKERFFPFIYRRGTSEATIRGLVKTVAAGMRAQGGKPRPRYIKPDPAPVYDEIFEEGVKALDQDAGDEFAASDSKELG